MVFMFLGIMIIRYDLIKRFVLREVMKWSWDWVRLMDKGSVLVRKEL